MIPDRYANTFYVEETTWQYILCENLQQESKKDKMVVSWWEN